jgi:hypothetical protein
MRNFLKDNSPIIGKLVLNQVGAAILGLSTSALATGRQPGLFALLSLFAVCFYLFLLYAAMWEEGGKERIKVDGGRADMKPLRGLYIALAANAVNIILALFTLIGFLFGSESGVCAWTWAGTLGSISKVIIVLFESMYIGIYQYLLRGFEASSFAYISAYFVIIIPGLLVSAGAYVLGLNNRRLLGKKKNKK